MSLFSEVLQQGLTAASIELAVETRQKLERHRQLVAEYNQYFNLTAITEEQDAAQKHYVDCLLALPLLLQLAEARQQQGQRLRAVDIGSGAGFPGLVLATACPQSEWLLLEAIGKKCRFLELCIEQLGLKNARVLSMRAEQAGRNAELRASHDLVVARAVAALPILLEYAAPLLTEGGVFAALKGPTLAEELATAANARAVLSMCLLEQQEHKLPNGDKRSIGVYQKTAPTPEKYPRRPGMPEKRPL